MNKQPRIRRWWKKPADWIDPPREIRHPEKQRFGPKRPAGTQPWWPTCRMAGCGLVVAKDRSNHDQPHVHGWCRAHAIYFEGAYQVRAKRRQEQVA